MKYYEFKSWLNGQGYSVKMQGDTISRLKKIEKEIGYTDIEDEYKNDKCKKILALFEKTGKNPEMAKLHNNTLPVGKYYLSAYKYAVKLYIKFIENR